MSVNPSAGDVLRSIPDARKPLRFRAVSADATGVRRARVPGAVGGPEAEGLFIWSMGVGPFVDAPLANMLQLRTDRDDGARPAAHGVVEPDAPMHVNVYVAALEATRDDWRVDEE